MHLPPVDRSTPLWRAVPAADLYSTGAGGAVPVRPVSAPGAVESVDRLGEGSTLNLRGEPTRPSDADQADRDWTLPETQKEAAEQAEETPPPPPLYQQLLEFIQSMWRASGSAVEVALEVNKTTLAERIAQQARDDEPLTYSDPKVKRTGGS